MATMDDKVNFSSSMGRIRKHIDNGLKSSESFGGCKDFSNGCNGFNNGLQTCNGCTDDIKGINLRPLYFRWLIDKLDSKMVRKYSSLLMHLFNDIFVENEKVPMDVNRARDGVALRKRFVSEHSEFGDSELESIIYEDCSWLEMLVALAERIDDQMMFDMNLGNRTNTWFWIIIEQMDLDKFDENGYVYSFVKDKLNRFIRRDYENGGKNGIFKCNRDVRQVEVWYQMQEWFDENSPKIRF